jgi:hypothetical protein
MRQLTVFMTLVILAFGLLTAATQGDTGPCAAVSPFFWVNDSSRCGPKGLGCVGYYEINWQTRRCMNQDESPCTENHDVPLATFTYPSATPLSPTNGKCLFSAWSRRDTFRRPINKYDCILDYSRSTELPGGIDCN